jgi:hypothetical protein
MAAQRLFAPHGNPSGRSSERDAELSGGAFAEGFHDLTRVLDGGGDEGIEQLVVGDAAGVDVGALSEMAAAVTPDNVRDAAERVRRAVGESVWSRARTTCLPGHAL